MLYDITKIIKNNKLNYFDDFHQFNTLDVVEKYKESLNWKNIITFINNENLPNCIIINYIEYLVKDTHYSIWKEIYITDKLLNKLLKLYNNNKIEKYIFDKIMHYVYLNPSLATIHNFNIDMVIGFTTNDITCWNRIYITSIMLDNILQLWNTNEINLLTYNSIKTFLSINSTFPLINNFYQYTDFINFEVFIHNINFPMDVKFIKNNIDKICINNLKNHLYKTNEVNNYIKTLN